MRRGVMTAAAIVAAIAGALALPRAAAGFCGFYVAKADTRLFNRASKVVIARTAPRTVITMANDYQGDLTEFALVIPVPDIPDRADIRIADMADIDHLDAYTAPRVVEYHDSNPCAPIGVARAMATAPVPQRAVADRSVVTIEASYTVGEYDILILSATDSSNLLGWLAREGYRLPAGAGPVLRDYLAAGMKFFVAKVNLAEQAALGFTYLRPLQLSITSPRFMLPIRLGMLNAEGKQELFVFALSRRGRVEVLNHPTRTIPTDITVPALVKRHFGDFYRDLVRTAVDRAGGRVVLMEYAWDMAWCDPCAADPLSVAQLRNLGATWLAAAGDAAAVPQPAPRPVPPPGGFPGGFQGGGQPRDVYVTRLHLVYDDAGFRDDLLFVETENRAPFQGRYVVHNAYTGPMDCGAPAAEYRRMLRGRDAAALANLQALTGWPRIVIDRKQAE